MSGGIERKSLVLLVAILLGLWCTVTAGKIIYVDDDANGLKNGTSWENAYKYLQDALDDANSSDKPVEIRVAQGIYRPDRSSADPNGTGDREATFQLINGVTLKGGYAGVGEPDPNARNVELYETILSGDLAGNDIDVNDPLELLIEPSREENACHIVTGTGSNTDANAILDSFTVTGGNANGGYNCGGGMYIYSGSPIVNNCIFTRNWGDWGGGICNMDANAIVTNCTFRHNGAHYGGGLVNYRGHPKITNCIFSGNSADDEGGGMLNMESNQTLTNCTFRGNFASFCGGGIDGGGEFQQYYGLMTNCSITDNIAGVGGGMAFYNGKAINCTISSNAAYRGGGMANCEGVFTNCTISHNMAEHGGGAIYNYCTSPIFLDCTITYNLAKSDGGGLLSYGDTISSDPKLFFCIISANSAGKNGGGLYNFFVNCHPVLRNCTMTGNKAEAGGGIYNESYADCYPTLANCILWGDSIPEIVKVGWSGWPDGLISDDNDDESLITYNDIWGGWPGEGNIDKDPCFAEPGYWDPNGTPQDPNDDFWVDGDYHLKSQEGRWDPNTKTWVKDDVTSPCIDAGDPASPVGLEPFPNGGIIDMGAYGGTDEASKSYFGEPPCEIIVAGDINGDCIVDFKDFALIAYHWLEEK